MSSTIQIVAGRRLKKDEFSQGLALRLRELRQQRGWTQSDLARQVGVVRTMIANYEGGFHHPPLQTLLRLAATLGVSVDFLLNGTACPQDSIQDRELQQFFVKVDKLDFRTRDTLKELILALLARHEMESKQGNHKKAA